MKLNQKHALKMTTILGSITELDKSKVTKSRLLYSIAIINGVFWWKKVFGIVIVNLYKRYTIISI